MTTLREEAFAAFRQGRAEEALALLTEVVRRTPLDHRARMAGAQCLAKLGQVERAATVLCDTAESLAQRDYLLSATFAAKLGLSCRPPTRASPPSFGGSTPAPPPAPGAAPSRRRCRPSRSSRSRSWSCALTCAARSCYDRAFEVLAGADGGPPAPPRARALRCRSSRSSTRTRSSSWCRACWCASSPTARRRSAAGEPGESIFIIVAGRARVEREMRGQKKVLAKLPGGSLFGELALLTGGRRTATVIAEGEAELFEVKAADLELVARRFPEVPRDIARYAEKRVAANMLVTAGLFDNLPAEQRAEVLGKFKPRFVSAGERVVVEGAGGEGLFLVMAGELSVTKKDAGGEPVALSLLRDGDVFGEISLLTGGPASASVTAVRKSLVAQLGRGEFEKLLEEKPAVGDYLKAVCEGRLKANAEAMHPAEILDAEELVFRE